MTTVPPLTVPQNDNGKTSTDSPITIRGKFKTVNLYNDTIHIILYPQDGLGTAAKLQEIAEGTDVVFELQSPVEGF